MILKAVDSKFFNIYDENRAGLTDEVAVIKYGVMIDILLIDIFLTVKFYVRINKFFLNKKFCYFFS